MKEFLKIKEYEGNEAAYKFFTKKLAKIELLKTEI